MRITASTNISNLEKPEDLRRFLSIFIDQAATTLNANLTFSDNFFAKLITYSFTLANTSVGIPHSLNAIPFGYLLVSSSAPMILYDGTQANTTSAIYLQSSATGTARILVLG